jgi:hypothetical protein
MGDFESCLSINANSIARGFKRTAAEKERKKN